MRNVKCSYCEEYRNEWCEKVIDSPHPDILRDCQYFHEVKKLDKDTNVPSTDCVSRQEALNALWKALFEYEDKTEKQFQESEELGVGDWFAHRIFVQNMSDIDRQTILNLPSAQPEVSRIEQELHGKTPEEQYEFLHWLLLRFALAYTDSRLAVVEWLRGEKEYERHDQQTGGN